MKNAVTNMEAQTSSWDPDFTALGSMLRSSIAGSHGDSMFKFFEPLLFLFSIAAAPFCISINNAQGSSCPYIIVNTCYFLPFFFNWGEEATICISVMVSDTEYLNVVIGHLYFFGECSSPLSTFY